MRLRKGYFIKVKVGNNFREGFITEFDYKNSERVVSYETLDGVTYWCYRNQIVDVRR